VDIEWMIPAETGWRALFELEGEEVGRSRVIGWGGVRSDDAIQVVGIIVDPNDPSTLVAAPDVIDPSGGEFVRYGFAP
jgi:hypothetical protein